MATAVPYTAPTSALVPFPREPLRRLRPRVLTVRLAVEAWRQRHPEFRREITIASLIAVLERERIVLIRAPLPRPGLVFAAGGVAVILVHVQLSGAALVRTVLHELAHIALNHVGDAAPARSATIDAQVEVEADLFVDRLLAGQHGGTGAASVDSTRRDVTGADHAAK